ncbi:MAG: patatin-like phospholipase family protein [Acidimicrobiales bacterium]|nr:patatin-like phospholipase family protein [Acidimicrobiales bacterium]
MNSPSRPRSRPAPDIAFVLPSGGSGGAVQVGILLAALEAGIRPDLLVGSSVGALNAAYLATDPSVERVAGLAEIWQGLGRGDVFGSNHWYTVRRLAMRHDHIFSPAPLRSLIARFCPLERLEDARVPVQVVTTDLDHGVARWWSRGAASEVLYAAACLPGLFPPAHLDGHRHVDGGVLEPVPVGRALDLDAATVYVLGEQAGPEAESSRPRTALDVLIRSFDISRYARLPEPGAMGRPGQRVVTLPGAATTGIAITDFTHTARLITESYEASRRFLAGRGYQGGLWDGGASGHGDAARRAKSSTWRAISDLDNLEAVVVSPSR